MAETLDIPVRPVRKFLPETFKIEKWDTLEPFFRDLSDRVIGDAEALEKWLQDWSELVSVVEEDSAWRYIRMTCDTKDKALVDAYNFFISEIWPKIEPFQDALNKKMIASPYLEKLDAKKFRIYIRSVKNQVELFREKNIPINVQISQESQKYGQISAEMTVVIDSKELTLQQAANYLKAADRKVRESVFFTIQDRRAKDEKTLQELLSKLIQLRNEVAINAGFSNFRDYKFRQLGRFDYTVEDCFKFHESISKEVVPATAYFEGLKKKKMDISVLKPWDTEYDPDGASPLKPCSNSEELINRTVKCFKKVDPWFASRMEVMKKMEHFDLDSRIGKAPGGYNSTLYEIGVPFIFMNSANSQRDLVTMVHEGGHAIHSFLTRDLELMDFKNFPSEVAELASMSMELMSMEYWEEFYSDPDDLKRARKEQLEKVLKGLTWIARVDKFQHWLYLNPSHTAEERNKYWLSLGEEFSSGLIDWTGCEHIAPRIWQAQLHIYEVPFYYIEYGFAQLGAIAVWRNYKEDPVKAVQQYRNALSIGYMRSIPEIYEAAGISFNFSRQYVKELVDFVLTEYKKL